MKYEMCIYVFLILRNIYCHLQNICMSLNLVAVSICYLKKKCVYMSYRKKLCVYMSFNTKRHIYTSVIFLMPGSQFGKQARAHQAREIHSLAHAAHAAHYLCIGNTPIQVAPLLSEKFIEPGEYQWQDVLQGA